MEQVKREGKAKSIGVSNYLIEHLETTLETAEVVPAVNQIEFHPYLQRGELVPWCEGKGIAVSAYGPLTPLTKGRPGPVDDVVKRIAGKYGVSEDAVLLRWCLQRTERGVAAITTSSKVERLQGYLECLGFELTGEELEEINLRGGEMHFRGDHFMKKWDEDDRR